MPRGFSAAIERATAKDRADRQATAGELANELRAGLTTAVEPNPALEFVETVALKEVDTKSDVNAPTVITIDSPQTSPPAPAQQPTSAPTVVERRKPDPPPPPANPSMSAATVAESAAMASSATAVPVAPAHHAPAAPASAPASAPVRKSSVGLIIGAVVLVGLIAVVGIAGYYLWNRSRTTTTDVAKPGTTAAAIPAPREITRYWLEVEPAREGDQPLRVAGLVPIASGQSFKFHFAFSESGYVYIFGPGNNNQPTAFLTSKPLPESGVTSNQATGGSDFSFPRGAGNNVTLDKNPGTDVFTVIFAKSALSSPSFLNEPVTGEPLSTVQQAELKSFVAKYAEKSPVTELDESNPRAPLVRVKVQPDQTNSPVVFEIRIQHN